MDFLTQYNLERYIFEIVTKRFNEQRYINAYDFFCIIIWKANRSKSYISKLILSHPNNYSNLEEAVYALTYGISTKDNEKEKLRYLLKEWRFQLPMATAILTALYPTKFSVYDVRVCEQIGYGDHHKLKYKVNFESQWNGYLEYLQKIEEITPKGLSLRDKDRYLWGKSFYEQLVNDIELGFKRK